MKFYVKHVEADFRSDKTSEDQQNSSDYEKEKEVEVQADNEKGAAVKYAASHELRHGDLIKVRVANITAVYMVFSNIDNRSPCVRQVRIINEAPAKETESADQKISRPDPPKNGFKHHQFNKLRYFVSPDRDRKFKKVDATSNREAVRKYLASKDLDEGKIITVEGRFKGNVITKETFRVVKDEATMDVGLSSLFQSNKLDYYTMYEAGNYTKQIRAESSYRAVRKFSLELKLNQGEEVIVLGKFEDEDLISKIYKVEVINNGYTIFKGLQSSG